MKGLRALLVLLLLLIDAGAVAAQSPQPAADDSAVVAWIRENAIPLQTVRPGSGFADLRPLETVLKDVRVLALGEATHGTSEFQQVKHRLLEFLVTRMGFTAFAIEAAYSDAQPMNDYVVHGRGNRDSVLTGLGYVAWDTEEFAAMVDWMRDYNRKVPAARRVRFYGLDVYRNAVGRRKVLAFVQRFTPDIEAVTDSLFRTLAEQEGRWPMWDSTVVKAAEARVEALASDLSARRPRLRGRVPAAEYGEVLRLVEVMRQGVSMRSRSRYMADNLIYLADRERPGTKFVYWAHDSHIARHARPWGGYYLRQRFGDAYYAVALTFDSGSYLARSFPPAGDLRTAAVPPAPPGAVEWSLARAHIPLFFLDLRAARESAPVGSWFRTPRNILSGGWAYSDGPRHAAQRAVSEWFDGILFVSTSTPTRPTANARSTAERKAGF